ncbi:hypothetical protein V8C86DRAFT_2873784 [Haematococcus lacustris]
MERNLDRNLAKRKRSRRPGQQPPQRRSANHPNFEEGQHDYEHPDPRPDADAREKTAGRIRKDRVEAEDAAWQERAPADRHDIIEYAPSFAAAAARRCELFKLDMQQQVVVQCCSGAAMKLDGWQTVEFVNSLYRFPLRLPLCTCLECNKDVAVSPVRLGCWGNTPVRPSIWFEQSLLQSYSTSMGQGMSVRGLMALLNKQHHPFVLYPNQKPIRTDVFTAAFYSYQAVAHESTSLTSLGCQGMPTGPFSDCPICATLPASVPPIADDVQDGATETGQGTATAYPVAASLNAVVKFNHFQGVGHASSAVQPRLASHVSPAGLDGEVQRRHEANQLNLEFSMAGDVQGLSHTCKATLSCSNPTAVSTATAKRCDITGVVGCTCCHGKTWMRYVAARGLPAAWADVKMWVPWMHAASHDQTCQLANNARYQMGAAFRVGEQAEQTWAMLKEMSKLVRYMTHAHRSDALQIRLAGIAFDKHANIVEHLAAKFKAMQMKKVDIHNQLVKLQEKSEAAGVINGVAAAAQYRDQHSQSATANDTKGNAWLAEYVHLKLTVQAVSCVAGLPLAPDACRDALPTLQPEMATLLANGRKLSQLRGIQDKVTTLGMAHGVHNLCGYWSSQEVEGSVHTVGLQLLKADMKARLQDAVWQDALLVSHVETKHKLWGVADKDTRALARESKAKMKHALQLLNELSLWDSLGTTQTPDEVRVTNSQLRGMVQGEPAPWEEECQSTPQGKVLFYGRKFLHLSSDSERCKEQLALLHVERARLSAWLYHAIHACYAAAAAATAGKEYYLMQHIEHLESMQAKLLALQWA